MKCRNSEPTKLFKGKLVTPCGHFANCTRPSESSSFPDRNREISWQEKWQNRRSFSRVSHTVFVLKLDADLSVLDNIVCDSLHRREAT